MRYYVEINGESSLDIQGLMIQNLPSISKPLMRSKQETIDGRDGDIVTKLGYSAYDKTLKIGLWGNYDINEVIAFFNQEGTITFSNEPDKYYRFTILNRDDYVSQLDKFRTCTIALHCQPYKYKLNEEAEELENEYVEQEGTSLTFNNTLVAPMNIDLKGNTLQNGTPTPSSPIPINNVSGDNDIVVCGKNLLNYDYNTNTSTYYLDNSGNMVTGAPNTYINENIRIDNTKVYSISFDSRVGTSNIRVGQFKENGTFISRTLITSNTTITLNNECAYIILSVDKNNNNYFTKLQLELSNQATTYEAYNGTTYNIDLPVENLFDKDNANMLNNMYINGSGVLTSGNGNASLYIPCKPNTSYTISKIAGNVFRVGTCASTPVANTQLSNYTDNATGSKISITTASTSNYLVVFLRNAETTITIQDILNSLQIEQGSKSNTYTPYGTTPIELNKIGTYQDYFYKENDKWYLHKEIGKYTFTGANDENWYISGSSLKCNGLNTTLNYPLMKNDYNYQNKTTLGVYSNYGISGLARDIAESSAANSVGLGAVDTGGGTTDAIYVSKGNLTVADIKTMLASNNLICNYVLATPTNIEITYTPLIEQLESIKNAMSKQGTTNVNQVNNDAPFIINASVLSGTDSITLTNEGNTTSKPTLTITGSGVVCVYLENIQMFNISLGTNETIIIDTENMEAYYGSQLKNRQVTGDYSNFALQSGTNNLKFTGVVTNVEITNYNRWI